MIDATYRFHGHGSLKYVFSKGATLRSRHLILRFSQNQRRKKPRIAVIVSKKVLKSAVGRNRIRRRIFEIIRLQLIEYNNPIDLAFIVTSAEVRTISTAELTTEVVKLLHIVHNSSDKRS